jgi:amino acid transporter
MKVVNLSILIFILLSVITLITVSLYEYDKDKEKNKEKRDKALKITGIILGTISLIGIIIIISVNLYMYTERLRIDEYDDEDKYPHFKPDSSPYKEISPLQKVSPYKEGSSLQVRPFLNGSNESGEFDMFTSKIGVSPELYSRSLSPPTSSEIAEIDREISMFRDNARKNLAIGRHSSEKKYSPLNLTPSERSEQENLLSGFNKYYKTHI